MTHGHGQSGGHGSSHGGGSKGSGSQSSGKSSQMDPAAASRIQSTGDKNTSSQTAKSGFGPRAQASAAKNQQ
ncbi:hypothetical protein BpHYR1_050997 [Brachionus plicatilis]|uniref:SMP domain-containing protein n=1 Tax=Brachionus plicatilis TaxID=10195 RepID=A0A3M7QDR3_BRAPC|nr:hypothetical protein BpHYR1_050997 [Brachionus plicatilis]